MIIRIGGNDSAHFSDFIIYLNDFLTHIRFSHITLLLITHWETYLVGKNKIKFWQPRITCSTNKRSPTSKKVEIFYFSIIYILLPRRETNYFMTTVNRYRITIEYTHINGSFQAIIYIYAFAHISLRWSKIRNKIVHARNFVSFHQMEFSVRGSRSIWDLEMESGNTSRHVRKIYHILA